MEEETEERGGRNEERGKERREREEREGIRIGSQYVALSHRAVPCRILPGR